MVKRNNRLYLLLFILIIPFLSCNSDRIYNKSYDLENNKWHKSNVLNFDFQVEDTLRPHHVFLNIRHTTKYEYRNLYLFIETTSPEGNSVRDTFEIMLANNKGRWYGSGWGDIYEVKTPYKQFVRFPNSGTYTMEVQQAMRTDQLMHVTDFGIQIEKAKMSEK